MIARRLPSKQQESQQMESNGAAAWDLHRISAGCLSLQGGKQQASHFQLGSNVPLSDQKPRAFRLWHLLAMTGSVGSRLRLL